MSHSLVVQLVIALVIADNQLSNVYAIKLNIREICSGTSTFFCSISHVNASFQDPIVLGNQSHPYVTELVLRNSQFSRIPNELFHLVPKLHTFIVHNCMLNRLSASDFNGTERLQKLVLQKNRLSDLPARVFASAAMLEELHLSSNTVHLVHRMTFSGLGRLTYLDLQQNAIEILPSGLFAELINLEHIDLSHNEIAKIDSDTFASNTKLQTLLLNDNKFSVFEPNSLEHLSHVRLLDVSNNVITELSLPSVDTLFAQNAMLERLTIGGSVIKIHAGNNKLVSVSVSDKLAVREIELHGNSLETLEHFIGMLNLQRLDVSRNQLKSLRTSQSPHHLPLPSLTTLNLAFNELNNLTAENFILLQKLTHLDIGFNRLRQLDYRIFEPLINLEKLYIEGNFLQKFNYVSFVQTHSAMRELGFYSNDWDPYYVHSMITYLKDHGIQLPRRFSSNDAFIAHDTETTMSDIDVMPTKAPHHANLYDSKNKHIADKVGVSGIHPYWTLRDILALAVLVGVAIVICLQFYLILKEEGCLPLRCCCTRQNREQNNDRRPFRLDEDDSEV